MTAAPQPKGAPLELIIGLLIIAGVLWGLSRLADYFEHRSFLLWLVFYLAAGALTIIVLTTARNVR